MSSAWKAPVSITDRSDTMRINDQILVHQWYRSMPHAETVATRRRKKTSTTRHREVRTCKRLRIFTRFWSYVRAVCNFFLGGGSYEKKEKKKSPPKVIWEECVAVAQVRNKVPTVYNGTPQMHPKTALSHSNTSIPRPTPLTAPNGIRIHSAVLPQYTFRTHSRHTDTRTVRLDKRHVYSNSAYACSISSERRAKKSAQ